MHVDGVARRHSAVLYWAFALDPGTGIGIIPSRLASYDLPTTGGGVWVSNRSMHTVCSDPMVAESKATYHSTS
jgi:hypothetical protein